MLILAFAAQLAIPISHPEVVVYKGVAGMAVLQDSVEERLNTDTHRHREGESVETRVNNIAVPP